MTGIPTPPSGCRPAWRERAFVLAGLGLALVATAAFLTTGAGARFIGPLWMAALAWTAAASLACALWRGFRHCDWSSFHGYEFPEDDIELGRRTARSAKDSEPAGLADLSDDVAAV